MPRAGSTLYLTVELCVRSLCAIIHASAWKARSQNFALLVVLGSLRWTKNSRTSVPLEREQASTSEELNALFRNDQPSLCRRSLPYLPYSHSGRSSRNGRLPQRRAQSP